MCLCNADINPKCSVNLYDDLGPPIGQIDKEEHKKTNENTVAMELKEILESMVYEDYHHQYYHQQNYITMSRKNKICNPIEMFRYTDELVNILYTPCARNKKHNDRVQ